MHQKLAAIAVFLFLAGGIVLLFGSPDWFPAFYSPRYMGVMSFLNALIIIMLPYVFATHAQTHEVAFERMRTMFIITLFLNATGSLGLYKLYLVGFPYDKFLHFTIPLLLTIALVHLRIEWWRASLYAALWWAAFVVFASGIGWELWEALSDWAFGTQSWGVYREYIVKDTLVDTVMNMLGILSAIGILRYGLIVPPSAQTHVSGKNEVSRVV